LQAEYNDATWASQPSFLNVDENYNAQKFTIPQSGLYRIQARGAAGGPISGSGPAQPGRGYEHKADFSLTRGEHLYIIVGQMGQTVVRSGNQAGPGGGGSFVFTESSGIETLLMAGAGGNGSSWQGHSVQDPDGRAPGGPDPANGNGRGSSGGSWDAHGVGNYLSAPPYGQAQGIGIGGGSDAKGANYQSAISNQQNFVGHASQSSYTGGGFGGGGTATPYEGGGGGGYKGGFAKIMNSYSSRHLDYGALSYVQSSATNKINVGLGPVETHGQIILTKLSS
jgi:hypothetical protein